MTEHTERYPIKHIIGFILSMALTLLAAWAALGTNLSTRWIIVSIMVMAVLQAGIQLFMFMHITESESRNGNVPWSMIFHGFVLAAIVVLGSLFTMYSGHGSGTYGGDHNEQQNEQQMDHGE